VTTTANQPDTHRSWPLHLLDAEQYATIAALMQGPLSEYNAALLDEFFDDMGRMHPQHAAIVNAANLPDTVDRLLAGGPR
jgi:hypothetical protein